MYVDSIEENLRVVRDNTCRFKYSKQIKMTSNTEMLQIIILIMIIIISIIIKKIEKEF